MPAACKPAGADATAGFPGASSTAARLPAALTLPMRCRYCTTFRGSFLSTVSGGVGSPKVASRACVYAGHVRIRCSVPSSAPQPAGQARDGSPLRKSFSNGFPFASLCPAELSLLSLLLAALLLLLLASLLPLPLASLLSLLLASLLLLLLASLLSLLLVSLLSLSSLSLTLICSCCSRHSSRMAATQAVCVGTALPATVSTWLPTGTLAFAAGEFFLTAVTTRFFSTSPCAPEGGTGIFHALPLNRCTTSWVMRHRPARS